MFYEDFIVGESFDTPRRTVNDTDLRQFIAYCALYEPLFMDETYLANGAGAFSQRVVPAVMTLSYSIGLGTLSGFTQQSGLAFLGLDRMRVLGPVSVGDTIYVRIEPVSKRLTSRPDRGIIVLKRTVCNQADQPVLEYETTTMIKLRTPTGAAETEETLLETHANHR